MLMMFSTTGFATNWIFLTETEDEKISLYIDTETIKKRNGYIYYWQLTNYKAMIRMRDSSSPAASAKAHYMADCNLDRGRHLSSVIYSGKMGGGKAIGRDDLNEWNYVVPGTLQDHIQTFVCSYFE